MWLDTLFWDDIITDMPNVEFEDQNISYSPRAMQAASRPGMTGWLMKKGIVKNEQAAQKFLIGLVIFNVLATIFVIAALL